MSYTSRFFNSTTEADFGYGASDFAEYFNALIRHGVLVGKNASALKVTQSTGLTVSIAPGAIFINGYMGVVYDNPEALILDGAGAQNRTDAVVMRLDMTEDRTENLRAGSIYPAIVKGTPGSGPPALRRDNDVWEMCLSQVLVRAGTTSLINTDLTDTRSDHNLCGYAAFLGAPAYYPPGDIPLLLWLYALFPGALTPSQIAEVEGDPALMAMWSNSRVKSLVSNSYFVNTRANRTEVKTSQNWTCPAGVTSVDVLLVGAGQGGLYYPDYVTPAPGGAGGQVKMVKNIAVTPGTAYPIAIGAGGASSASDATRTGGDTTAFGETAKGGSSSAGGNIGGYNALEQGGSLGVFNGSGFTIRQERLTMDPYTGVPYAGGGGQGDGGYYGGGHFGSSATGNDGEPNTGGGGKGGYGPSVYGGSGGSGLVVIYY